MPRIIQKTIITAMPGDLKPFAAIILPVLSKMIEEQGWDAVRMFLFAYKGQDQSWARKLTRNMTVKQRIAWRQTTSEQQIRELKAYHKRAIRTAMARRLLVQRVMTSAIEIVIGTL